MVTERPTGTPKQVLILRKDLGMRKGKMIAQGAHASVKVILDHKGLYPLPRPMQQWLEGTFTKVVVSVSSEEDLLALYQEAKDQGIPCALIQDIGKTEFGGVPTYTAVAIGPDYPERIDPITGDLRLL